MKNQLLSTILMPLIGLLFACADASTPGTQVNPQDMMVMTGGIPVVDMSIPSGGTPAGSMVQNGRELQIIGDVNLFAPINSQVPLKVRLFAGGSMPIPNSRISFTMLNAQGQESPQGIEGSGLSSQNAVTNAIGEASVQLNTGMIGTSFKVRASEAGNPSTPFVTWNINVASATEGGITVDVSYDLMNGRLNYSQFSSAEVRLFENVECSVVEGRLPNLTGAFLELAPIMPFNDVDHVTSASALPKDVRFTVVATLLNRNGTVVAFGCDKVQITAAQTSLVKIVAKDLALSYNKGTFTAVHKFNLIESLRASNNDNFKKLADILELVRLLGGNAQDVGSGVIDLVCDLAELSPTTCGFASDFLSELVGGAILQYLPEEVRRILNIVGDILNIAAGLTFVGELQFTSSPDAMGMMRSNDNRWQKIRFDWQGSRQELTLGQLGDRNAMRPIAGVFDAQVEGDHVNILEHSFEIRYGDILLGLLENWILPSYYGSTDPITLQDFLRDTEVCARINEGVGLSPDSTICDTLIINALTRVLEAQISNLNFSASDLMMTGSFEPGDLNGDQTVDQLKNGQWSGNWRNQFVFKGCFSACLNQECAESDCQIME